MSFFTEVTTVGIKSVISSKKGLDKKLLFFLSQFREKLIKEYLLLVSNNSKLGKSGNPTKQDSVLDYILTWLFKLYI